MRTPRWGLLLRRKADVETLETGKPITPFMDFGDVVRIEMLDRQGVSVFDAIEQRIVKADPSA